jgi:hypothetical protein
MKKLIVWTLALVFAMTVSFAFADEEKKPAKEKSPAEKVEKKTKKKLKEEKEEKKEKKEKEEKGEKKEKKKVKTPKGSMDEKSVDKK